jgi:hypothetical protein
MIFSFPWVPHHRASHHTGAKPLSHAVTEPQPGYLAPGHALHVAPGVRREPFEAA